MGHDVSEPSSAVLRRQNDPAIHELIRAMSASHLRAQRLDDLSTALSVAVAAAGFAGAFITSAANAITAVGALWALAYSMGLATWTGAELRRAATIQEMLDVDLYGLEWNYVIADHPVGAAEISRLNARFTGRDDMVHDYYEIPDFPNPYDVVACQMMNLGWGARVRLRFAYTILAALLAWAVAGAVIGVVTNATVAQLLLGLYVPSLGGLMLGLDMFGRQRDVVNERQRVLHYVRSYMTNVRSGGPARPDGRLHVLTRQVQDAIFLTRVSCPRVPNWFFLRFRDTDRRDFQADMKQLQSLIHPADAPLN